MCKFVLPPLDMDGSSIPEFKNIQVRLHRTIVLESVSLRFKKDVCSYVDIISSLHQCLSGRIPIKAHRNQSRNGGLRWLCGRSQGRGIISLKPNSEIDDVDGNFRSDQYIIWQCKSKAYATGINIHTPIYQAKEFYKSCFSPLLFFMWLFSNYFRLLTLFLFCHSFHDVLNNHTSTYLFIYFLFSWIKLLFWTCILLSSLYITGTIANETHHLFG